MHCAPGGGGGGGAGGGGGVSRAEATAGHSMLAILKGGANMECPAPLVVEVAAVVVV